MAAAASFSLVSIGNALPSGIGSSSSTSSNCSSFNGTRVSFAPATSCTAVRCRPSSARTIMMGKREMEMEELRKMSDEELRENVVELKGELVVLRMKKVARQDVKPSEFQRMRKRIARMLTIHRERELEKGIKKRESRKLDRAWRRSVEVKPPPSLVAVLDKRKEAK